MALAEKIIWSVPPDLPEVEILSVKNNQRPWCVYHLTYTICNLDVFVNEDRSIRPGIAEWAYRRKIHQNPAQTLMLLEPGEVHRNTKTPPPGDFSVVMIDPKLVNNIALEAGMRPNPHLREAATRDARLYRAFFRFHAALLEQTTLLHRQSLLVDAIQALLANHCEKTPDSYSYPDQRRLKVARDFLEQHFSEKITLNQLAKLSGLSRYYFLHSFTREFGLPPHAYQINLRVEKIRQLLRAGFPLHSIEAGFADQSHLIRHFKTLTGVTPAQYTSMIQSSMRRQFDEQ